MGSNSATAARRAIRELALRLLLLLAAGSLLVTGLAFGARLAWGLELLSHFRVQYAAAQILLLAAVLIARRPRWAAALAAGLFANATILAPYLPRLGTAEAAVAADALTVMTVNLQAGNRRSQPLLDMLRTAAPDVLLLVEFTPDWERRLAKLYPDYAHRLLAPRHGAFGLALLSRHPLLSKRELDLEGTLAIDAEVATPSGTIRLIGVHLRPPTRPRWLAERNRQLDRLAALRGAVDSPLLVLGDFNSTPYSPYFSDWLRDTELRTTLTHRGPGISWPTFLPLLGIPIDHCVVSAEFMITDHRRLPAFGSDHYPMLARIALPRQP